MEYAGETIATRRRQHTEHVYLRKAINPNRLNVMTV